MEHTEVKNEAGFDKEAWLEQKQADRKDAFDLIDVTADSMGSDPELFQSCLDVMARFERYSVGNVLLLTAQNPNATRLADFGTWKNEGISIKKGAKSILILEPGKDYTKADGKVAVRYNAKRVFDISQTDANPAPQAMQYDMRQLLTALVHTGSCQAEIRDELPDDKTAIYDSDKKRILLLRGLVGNETLFKEYARELVMAYQDTDGNALRKECAFVAMCSTYVLCRRYGMDTSDFNFRSVPDQCSEMDATAMRRELSKIRAYAARIYGDISHHMEKSQKQPQTQEAR